jgi:hypothetical protein
MTKRKCFDLDATIAAIVAADMVQFDAMAAAADEQSLPKGRAPENPCRFSG